MLLAQLTDLHIKPRGRLAYRQVDTAACLEAAVAQVNRLHPAPDAVLLTGDLTDNGLAEEYGLLRELLAPMRFPLFVIPGNHDARPTMRAAFGPQYLNAQLGAGDGPMHHVVEDFSLRFVLLDSLVPGQGGGELGAAQLDWLNRTLAAAPERPTVIAVHHPPFPTGIGHMDRVGLADREAFATIVRQHPQVERVLSGHVHRSIQLPLGRHPGLHRPVHGAPGGAGPASRRTVLLPVGAARLPAASLRSGYRRSQPHGRDRRLARTVSVLR